MYSIRIAPEALHIPDGFLSVPVSLVGWGLALGMIVLAVRLTRRQLGERQVPLMGVLAAFIFAGQAVNFPVAAGTSGHLLGGALAAIVLGPWAASLVMTAVIAVQGLLFQDGGLLVMGWNILNMGIFTAFSGHLAYSLVRRLVGDNTPGRLAGAFVAGWLSVEIGAMATAVELALSGTSPLAFGLPAMVGVHALIGLGEGLITSGAIAFLLTSRPEVVRGGERAPGRTSASVVLGGLLLALLVGLVSPLASSNPDGLEAVAQQQGFFERGLANPFEVLPDYTLPFVEGPVATTLLAVGLGTLVVFAVSILAGRLALRRRPVER